MKSDTDQQATHRRPGASGGSPALALGNPIFEPKLQGSPPSANQTDAWQRAFTQHGPQAALHVSGDFAVGLHAADGRSFIAVDRFAIQTLCYCVVDGRLHFAERADDLADAETAIDPQAIFDYLYFHVIASPRTIYKGIYRLPPGHYGLLDKGQLTIAPYWSPTFAEERKPSFDSLKDEFRELLQVSVADRLDGGKKACFLSGGTDSSTVAGMAARAGTAPTATYSIGFDAEGYDEMEFARLTAKHFQTEHHEYYVTPDDLVRSMPLVAAHYDQPFGNSSVLPAYYCAKMAREDGVSTLLAGDGGDELFGGNSRYAKQRVFGYYDRVPRVVQKGLMEPVLGTRMAAAFPLSRRAGSYVEQARIPMPDRLQIYNLVMRMGVGEVLSPKLLSQVDITAPLDLQRQVWNQPTGCSSLNQELAYDWRFTLAETDLRKVMGATNLAGVATGFPMLDDRLLAFSLRLPTHYKLKGLQLRWFFKEALRGFLPDQVIAKKKQGFGLPFGVWANKTPTLKALAKDSLESLAARGVVPPGFVNQLLTKWMPEHPGYFGEMVWILTMLELWLRAKAPNYRVA